MKNGKFIIARLFPDYRGDVHSTAPVILGINPQRYETIVVYLTKNSDKANIFEQKGKKVFYLSNKPQLPFFKPRVFLKLAKIFRDQGVDIAHCHTHKATVYGTIAGVMAGVPVILAHVHGLGRTRNLRRRILNYFIFRHIKKILAIGQAVKEDILTNNKSVKAENVINLGNSIDYEYYVNFNADAKALRDKFQIPQDAFVFATAGRLVPTKGQGNLIEAFAKLKKTIPNINLVFAGEGPLRAELQQKVDKLDCRDSVHFLGRLKNMPQFYSAIDCFILPSVAEGLPRTLLEAMAAGVLCVASKVGGIPEILDNGRLGLLVPPENSAALADAMLKSHELPQENKNDIINSARDCIKNHFNHPVAVRTLEDLYDKCMMHG